VERTEQKKKFRKYALIEFHKIRKHLFMLLRFTSEEENNGESIEKAGKVNVLSALLYALLPLIVNCG